MKLGWKLGYKSELNWYEYGNEIGMILGYKLYHFLIVNVNMSKKIN